MPGVSRRPRSVLGRLIRPEAARRLAGVLALTALTLTSQAAAVPYRPDVLARLKGGARAQILAEEAQRPAGVDALPARFRFSLSRYAPASVVTTRAVVILADFDDQVGTALPAHFDSLLFSPDAPAGSLRQFYLENSYGRFEVTAGVVTPWLRMPHTLAYYANNLGGLGSYPQNGQGLAEDAVDKANHDLPTLDFAEFDDDGPDGIPRSQGSTDDDGYVDFVIIVHAGTGRETSGLSGDIHSHTWLIPPSSTRAFVDGVRVQPYTTEPEDGQVGVFCHEFGHLLGLPDLYSGSARSVVGIFSLMSTGVWAGLTEWGDRPVHLDAWSKAELGFLTPTVPSTNLPGSSLPPAETSPSAWKIWTNGEPGPEYFLVENRQFVGWDDTRARAPTVPGLPAAGFVVYHVDERISGNIDVLIDDWHHPRVAVVEADGDTYGRGELLTPCYTGCAAVYWGEASDVYPAGATAWSVATIPSTRAYDGTDTQVALSDIHTVDVEAYADLVVENRPAVRWEAALVDEEPGSGDGDGTAYAGEVARVVPTVRNAGITATSVTATAGSSDPLAPLVDATPLVFGTVPAESSAADGAVRLALAATLPADPYAVPLTIDVAGDGYAARDSFRVAVGATYAFGDDAESSVPRLTSGTLATGGEAAWRRVADANTTPGGAWTWKCGSVSAVGQYANRLDAVLESPPLLLDGTGALRIQSRIDAETAPSGGAYDGGMVEISIAGRPWQPLEPEGGYPYVLRSSTGLPAGAAGLGVLSGYSTGYVPYVFPLTGVVGEARVRFRFVSDFSNPPASPGRFLGWFVDDIQVDTDRQPYTVTLLDPVLDEAGMHLTWRVSAGRGGYDRAGFAVWRGVGSSGSATSTVQRSLEDLVPVTAALVAPSGDRATVLDPSPPAGVPLFYVLADSAAGAASRLAAFSSPQAPVTLRIFPSPVQLPTSVPTILYQVPATGHVTVRITDVAGRTLATLVDGTRFAGPQAVTWDGRIAARGSAAGRLAPSGMYVAVVETPDTRGSVRFLVVR